MGESREPPGDERNLPADLNQSLGLIAVPKVKENAGCNLAGKEIQRPTESRAAA